jgi:hypothetical protein
VNDREQWKKKRVEDVFTFGLTSKRRPLLIDKTTNQVYQMDSTSKNSRRFRCINRRRPDLSERCRATVTIDSEYNWYWNYKNKHIDSGSFKCDCRGDEFIPATKDEIMKVVKALKAKEESRMSKMSDGSRMSGTSREDNEETKEHLRQDMK